LLTRDAPPVVAVLGLDLCAASFGSVFCRHQAQREHALADFAKPTKRTHVKLAKRMKWRLAALQFHPSPTSFGILVLLFGTLIL
jgi:hypothetical protein